MSDRAPVNLIVHACPPGQEQAILKFMEQTGLSEDFGFYSRETELRLHTVYGADDMALDAYGDIAVDLSEVAPGAAFEVWTDPKYEWDGGITMYTRELGFFNGKCNSEGEPYLTAHEWMKNGGMTRNQIDAALGVAWELEFQRMRNGG